MAEGALTATRSRSFLSRKQLAVWATAFLCVSWYLHGWEVLTPGLYTRSGDFKVPDYVQFYVMGSLLRDGRAKALYDARAHAREADRRIAAGVQYHAPYPNYGPQIAFAFVPLAALPFGWSALVFSIISASVYAAAVWYLWRGSTALRREPGLVAILAICSPAFLFTLRFGQLSTFSLLALALAAGAARVPRQFATGVCLGLLAFKPQLLVAAVPMFMLARDWRGLAGVVAASAGQVAIALYAVGIGPLVQYGNTLWNLMLHPDLVVLFPEIAHSLRGFLRLIGVHSVVAGGIPIVVLLALLPTLVAVWRSDQPALMRVGLLVAVTVLVTPHLITYDLLLLAVPFMAAADWILQHRHQALGRHLTLVLMCVYLAPFSPILAALTRVQLSTVAIALLVVMLCKAVRMSTFGCRLRAGSWP